MNKFRLHKTVSLASPLGTLLYPVLPKLMMYSCPQTISTASAIFYVHLTLIHCSNYQIELVADKTKLQVFLPKSYEDLSQYFKSSSAIKIYLKTIPFSDLAENLGVLRSTEGNLPNILNRVKSHKKALGSVCSTGLAWGHRSNPQATLRINSMYGIPDLLSGLATPVLKQSEGMQPTP